MNTPPTNEGGFAGSTGGQQSTSSAVKDKVGGAASQVKDQADQAQQKARSKAIDVADQQKGKVVQQGQTIKQDATKVAEQLRQNGQEKPAELVEKASERFDDLLGYVDNKSVDQMIADLGRTARRNPMTFVGAMFGLGIVASRLIKAGSDSGNEWESQQQFRSGQGYGYGYGYGTGYTPQTGAIGRSDIGTTGAYGTPGTTGVTGTTPPVGATGTIDTGTGSEFGRTGGATGADRSRIPSGGTSRSNV